MKDFLAEGDLCASGALGLTFFFREKVKKKSYKSC
jgi:hypothetical protein